MQPEIGHLLLIMSTAMATLLALVPMFGLYHQNDYLQSYVKPLSAGMTVAILLSIGYLGYGFISDDFSISYVANHSNTQLEWFYKVAALWGSHEGSMLLWVGLIALWGSLITFNQSYSTNKQDAAFIIRMQSVLAAIIVGFNLFLLFTSNPFARNLPNIPIEGRDLNPILQDIGLILHPPLLFLGYVGLTICFAAAMAALIGGELTKKQAGFLRPWALLAWVFLTGGNAFGSWWAYNELGWGGWWFWDPVENASFIPWLVATALLHSVLVTKKNGNLKISTLFLCLLAFGLSLLGTFLVRSGIVQSVHAFATDPTRGMSILTLLLVFIGFALALFAIKGSKFKQALNFHLLSKESFMLAGIAVLVVAALSVLLGTFYPLMFELMGLGTLSVGAPYFNSIFVPLTFICVLLMGITPLIHWKQFKWSKNHKTALAILGLVTLIIPSIICGLTNDPLNHFLWLGSASALWLLGCLSLTLWPVIQRKRPLKLKFIGMSIAHFGVVVSIIGATAISNFEEEAMLRMGPGMGKALGNYIFVYEATENVNAKSYNAIQARIAVRDLNEELQFYLFPQRQTFKTNGMEVSQAGINHGFLRDLYITKGQQLSDTEYLIRISIKPFASWIWLGAMLMMFGGLLCLVRRRVNK